MKAGLLKEGESLYDASNIILMHHLNAALRAHTLFHRDVDYIVKNDEVVIVDEHTGRTCQGDVGLMACIKQSKQKKK